MVTFLVIVLLLDGFFLMGVILLQAGKGGGLAAVGGGASTDNFIGGRQAASLLTRSTWTAGAIFLALSLVLAVMSTRGGSQPDSLLQREFQQGPAAAPQPLELPGTEGGFEGEEPAAIPGTDAGAGTTGEPAPAQP